MGKSKPTREFVLECVFRTIGFDEDCASSKAAILIENMERITDAESWCTSLNESGRMRQERVDVELARFVFLANGRGEVSYETFGRPTSLVGDAFLTRFTESGSGFLDSTAPDTVFESEEASAIRRIIVSVRSVLSKPKVGRSTLQHLTEAMHAFPRQGYGEVFANLCSA